ncbi:MAG: hypothetical protein JWN81_1052 [Solirubrobacterales bacterium]|jgi:hypothetical protein|nr:hypothetical protein [Solirubrobacterales bacterium]
MGQLDSRALEDLEGELRARAFARNAELMTGTCSDGRFRAAFVQFGDRIARRGTVLLEAAAGDKHVALEWLIAADAERPPHR